eukprot:scaffold336_cov250-Pinguiococcus_pyrenoidosus.AAC.24
MATPGGFGSAEEVTDEVKDMVVALQEAIQESLSKEYDTFDPVSYVTQVVAGTNYLVKVHVGESDYVHVKIHEPLPHKNEAPRLMEASSGHDADTALHVAWVETDRTSLGCRGTLVAKDPV